MQNKMFSRMLKVKMSSQAQQKHHKSDKIQTTLFKKVQFVNIMQLH